MIDVLLSNGLLGIVIGAVLAGAIGIFTDWRNRVHKRKTITKAFNADMCAISEIIRRRNYIAELRNHAIAEKHISFQAKQDYFDVYNNLISEIGLLREDMIGDVINFYKYGKSALEDIEFHLSPTSEFYKEAYIGLAEIFEQMCSISVSFSKKCENYCK